MQKTFRLKKVIDILCVYFSLFLKGTFWKIFEVSKSIMTRKAFKVKKLVKSQHYQSHLIKIHTV